MTAISDKYAQLGGLGGLLGPLIGPETAAANGGLKQEFQRGAIYWHPNAGAWEVHGAIRAAWLALGGEGSVLGYPLSDETAAPDNIGRFNDFQNCSMYWHPNTGAWEVHGPIRDRWRALGGPSSTLGYPLTHETSAPDGRGRFNHFQRGSIHWTPETGAQEVFGAIRSRWAELGWERSIVGYPTMPPYTETRNREAFLVAQFKAGRIELNQATQRVIVWKSPAAASPNYRVPLVAYQVSDDDGSRPCAITVDSVQQWVSEANRVFAAAGIEFVYDGVLRELRDTQVNNVTGEAYPFWPTVRDKLNNLAAQDRAVVVVHRADIGGGFSSSTYDFVAMSFFDPALNALSILAHELGHHFGLPHTFSRIFATQQEAEDFVLGGGRLADLDGDVPIISDTPPDPYITELGDAVTVNAVTLAGQAVALARRNIMSYWHHDGRGQLSAQQISRVRSLVLERKSRYLDVTVVSAVDCPALVARIDALKTRLAELIADRDAEADPFLRRRYAASINIVRGDIAVATNAARFAGCL